MTTLEFCNKAHRILWLTLTAVAVIGAFLTNPYQLWLAPVCWLVSTFKWEDRRNAENQ